MRFISAMIWLLGVDDEGKARMRPERVDDDPDLST
jgi:hypothetical protein